MLELLHLKLVNDLSLSVYIHIPQVEGYNIFILYIYIYAGFCYQTFAFLSWFCFSCFGNDNKGCLMWIWEWTQQNRKRCGGPWWLFGLKLWSRKSWQLWEVRDIFFFLLILCFNNLIREWRIGKGKQLLLLLLLDHLMEETINYLWSVAD